MNTMLSPDSPVLTGAGQYSFTQTLVPDGSGREALLRLRLRAVASLALVEYNAELAAGIRRPDRPGFLEERLAGRA